MTHRAKPAGRTGASSRRERRRALGFSLVELVVVIVIIGILASMAIPRLSRGTVGAADASLRGDLKTLRTAIARYAAEHGGTYPGEGGNEALALAQLLQYSDRSGATGTYNPGAGRVYGPYLQRIPVLSVSPGDNAWLHDPSFPPVPDGAGGWVYNPATGVVCANTLENDANGDPYSNY